MTAGTAGAAPSPSSDPKAAAGEVAAGGAVAAAGNDPVLAEVLARLPEGGVFEDGLLHHTVQKGQSLETIARKYLRLTDFYSSTRLANDILERNSFSRPSLSVGKRVVIGPPRRIPFTASPLPRDPDFVARGVYVSMNTAAGERALDLVRRFKPLGLNTLIVDIKDMDGIVAIPSQVPLALKTQATQRGALRDPVKLVNLLHAQGIHVVARQVLFYDEWVTPREPRLAIRSKNGGPWLEHGRLAWLDPANREVQEYNLALAREVAGLGFDEIQFDYVRFPAMGRVSEIEYSFDLTKTQKHQVISDFLERARAMLKPMGVMLSIDVYGVVAWDEGQDVAITGQRLQDLGRHVDAISPMVYPSHFYPPFDGFENPAWQPYHFVSQGVRRTLKKIAAGGGTAQVRPWLQAFAYKVRDRFNDEYIAVQLRAARDAGGHGWLLWDAGNGYHVGERGVARFNREPNVKPKPAPEKLSAEAAPAQN